MLKLCICPCCGIRSVLLVAWQLRLLHDHYKKPHQLPPHLHGNWHRVMLSAIKRNIEVTADLIKRGVETVVIARLTEDFIGSRRSMLQFRASQRCAVVLTTVFKLNRGYSAELS